MQKTIKIGIDEAGRGPWAGPVVAASFAFNPCYPPEKRFIKQLDDSKKLTKKKREILFSELIKMSIDKKPKVFFGLGVVDNFMIDATNITQANKEAMRRALGEIMRKIGQATIGEVQVDGNDNYTFEGLEKKPECIIGGDSKVTEIGAASIIAKVFRDDLMNTYSKLYPHLGFESHKGYGTKKHKESLKDNSCVTGIHRISYQPVKKVLENKK